MPLLLSVLIIFFLSFVTGAISAGIIKSTFKFIAMFIFGSATAIFSALTIFNYEAKHISNQVVDLPEEYVLLSNNSNKPDTVLAFYDNDTVYIGFMQSRHVPKK